MRNDIMVDKPSLTSAHLVAPLIVTNNCLSSKCYNVFRPHARSREAGNCTGKRKETEKFRSKIRCKLFHILLYNLTLHERCIKCEAQDCGPLFKCSVAKHLKECKNGCSLTGKEVSLDLIGVFSDLTIQYGKNEALHLLALKEVNAKEAPDMTQEESIGL